MLSELMKADKPLAEWFESFSELNEECNEDLIVEMKLGEGKGGQKLFEN